MFMDAIKNIEFINTQTIYLDLPPGNNPNATPNIDLTGSEFIDNLMQKIWMSIYQGLWDGISSLFGWMQDVQSTYIVKSKNLITLSPQQWNSVAFDFIKGVTQDAVIPIAGCIITFVFAWQIISMVQESNQMHNIKPETMLILMLKLGICLLVCAKSFEIVNGLFEVSAWAVNKIPVISINDTFKTDLNSILPREQEEYSFGKCAIMLSYWFITLIAVFVTYGISIAIYIRVNIWYLELLIYASAAPMPFATFMNKEWGQMGTNYLRKTMAMSFEGFFMIIAFGLYNAMTINILSNPTGDNYLISIISAIGCGVGLMMIVSKAGTISSSIFNAH